jgi:hypothetical protein
VLASTHDERAIFRQQAFAPTNGMLDQRPSRQIPEDFGSSRDTLRFKPGVRDPVSHQLPLSQMIKAAAAISARHRIRMRSPITPKKLRGQNGIAHRAVVAAEDNVNMSRTRTEGGLPDRRALRLVCLPAAG